MKRQIADLQTSLHQAEPDLEDLLANIAIVPDPASESLELKGADQSVVIAGAFSVIPSNTYVPRLDCSRKQ